jgi:S-DNA-T family DNA segregation ATPase FtsK/SpoIIIE
MLEDAVQEMELRIVAVQESGSTDGITRDMQRTPGSGFHPLILLVDEAQVAFMCPAKGDDGRPYGGSKATSRYFMAARKLHNQGRAVNVLLWEGTQDPTDQNLPKLVHEGAHIRASLALGTESQSHMALGDKAVDGGAAPHELRQGQAQGGRDQRPPR